MSPVVNAATVAVSDLLTVGQVTASASTGVTVQVPITITDVATTPLGQDQASLSKIGAFGLQVNFGNTCLYTNATDFPDGPIIDKTGGIIGSLTPTSETVTGPGDGSSVSWIYSRAGKSIGTANEGIPTNTTLANQLLGNLSVALNSCPAGTVIPLTITASGGAAPALGASGSSNTLTETLGTPGSCDTTTGAGCLVVVNGSITTPGGGGPTATPIPATNTPVPTATNTPTGPTATPPPATNTPVPTNTAVPTATRTNTPIPTATNTPNIGPIPASNPIPTLDTRSLAALAAFLALAGFLLTKRLMK
jgi:hypothetical protein